MLHQNRPNYINVTLQTPHKIVSKSVASFRTDACVCSQPNVLIRLIIPCNNVSKQIIINMQYAAVACVRSLANQSEETWSSFLFSDVF